LREELDEAKALGKRGASGTAGDEIDALEKSARLMASSQGLVGCSIRGKISQ
jgi:hypothetical protein